MDASAAVCCRAFCWPACGFDPKDTLSWFEEGDDVVPEAGYVDADGEEHEIEGRLRRITELEQLCYLVKARSMAPATASSLVAGFLCPVLRLKTSLRTALMC